MRPQRPAVRQHGALPFHVAIAGPTASGKTAAALATAQELAARGKPVEIISVDSALVYRGMDIGTAKPTAAERAMCPHHLIDIRDPWEPYSAAEFARDAERLLHEITARGALPLLVGGTMLYFKALWEGLDDLPPADSAVRAQIDAEAQALGWPALHARLREVDATTAARLSPNDAQRISRALEVHTLTGQPLSDLHRARTAAQRTTENAPDSGADREHPCSSKPLISLEPQDRAVLHARIAARLEAMLEGGLIEEVQRLRGLPEVQPDLPAMRAVGYRQVWQALDGEFSLAELRGRAIAATRQLAKRQLTWLRSMSWRQVVPCDDAQAQINVVRHGLAAAGFDRIPTDGGSLPAVSH